MKSIQFKIIGILAFCLIYIAAKENQVKNLLVIGDSISIGYMPFVEKALAPGIMVAHNPGDVGSTVRGVENIEKSLDNRQWDSLRSPVK